MALQLLPRWRVEHVRPQLVEAASGLRNLQGVTYPAERFNAYLKWTGDQLGVLRHCLSRDALNRLITTDHYRTLCLLDPATKGNQLYSVVDIEIARQIDEFDAALNELDVAVARHEGADLVLVPDTNVFLQGLVSFENRAWSELLPRPNASAQLAIPLLVIDELDKAKLRTNNVHPKSDEKVRARARRTLRALEQGFAGDDPYQLECAGQAKVTVTFIPEDARHIRLPRPDDELVDIAQGLAAMTSAPVLLVSDDTGLRLRASIAGLNAIEPPGDEPAD